MYTHNARYQLSSETESSAIRIINYGYDDATSWHTKTWTTNSEWSYEYDNIGRLDVVTDFGSNLSTDYNYDTTGNVSTITVTQDTTTVRSTTHTYNPQRHWLTKIEHKDGSGANLSTHDYVRRADGQILQVGETVKQPDNMFVVTQQNYTYDALNRLAKEVVDTSTMGADFTNEYMLDLVGNRTEKIETKEAQSPVSTTYSYNARDQLLSETDGTTTINYGYDSNGSLTTQSGNGSNRTQSWDIRGRLDGATVDGVTTNFEYTSDGIRSSVMEGSSSTDYIIDGMTPSGYAQVIEELESGLSVVRYTYGSSLDPISENRSGTDAAYLGDGHSGVRQAVDASGAVLLVQRFDAYGRTVEKAGTLQSPIGYRGERYDTTLGQYYLRARYYNPASGRFTGVDKHQGTYLDPFQILRYSYASGNPVSGMDPSGYFTTTGSLATINVRVTNFVNYGRSAYNIYSKLSMVHDYLTFLIDMTKLFSNVSNLGARNIRRQLTSVVNASPDFGRRLQQQSMEEAGEVFAMNIGKIFGNLSKIVGSIGTGPHARLMNLGDAYREKKSRLVIMMPTPEYLTGVQGPNPLFIIPTPMRMTVLGEKRKISLYFGHKYFQGRMFGFGVIKDKTQKSEEKPFQLFRMDWHKPHSGHTPGNDYWIHSGTDYHFHLVDKRNT